MNNALSATVSQHFQCTLRIYNELTSTVQVILLIVSTADAVPIDNGLVGDVSIECGSDGINISVDTKKAWSGRLYANGYSNESDCVVRSSCCAVSASGLPIHAL